MVGKELTMLVLCMHTHANLIHAHTLRSWTPLMLLVSGRLKTF